MINQKVLSILLLTIMGIQAGEEEKKVQDRLFKMYGKPRIVQGRRVRASRNGYVKSSVAKEEEPSTPRAGGFLGVLDGSNFIDESFRDLREEKIPFDFAKLAEEAAKLEEKRRSKKLPKHKLHTRVQRTDYNQSSRSGISGQSNRALKV